MTFAASIGFAFLVIWAVAAVIAIAAAAAKIK